MISVLSSLDFNSLPTVTELLRQFSRKIRWLDVCDPQEEGRSMQTIYATLSRFLSSQRALSPAVILLALFVSAPVSQATDGDLDPSFGISGQVTTDIDLSTDIA